MALPAIGLQTVFGIGEESTYGTAVAPTRFYPIASESLALAKHTIESDAMLPGAYNTRLAARRVLSSKGVTGDFNVDVTTKAIGLILKYLFGPSQTVTVTQQGATTAYLHTYNLALSGGKSLTIQKQLRDNAGAAIQAFDYSGCKIIKGGFSISTDAMLKLALSVDGRNEAKQASPTTASYVTQKPFYFAQAVLSVGGTPIAGDIIVKSATIDLERPMDVDRRGLGNAGLKGEQAENDFPKVTGSLACEFVRAADWYDAFAADTQLALALVFTGAQIASPYNEKFQLDLPAIFLDGESPKVGGPGVVSMTVPFTALSDGTNSALKATYITTDTAV